MKRALIVDDNATVRAAIRAFLERHTELSVAGEAADGSEAVSMASELRPDLVLMDLSMPILGGAAAASVIKTALPHARVILFTLYSDLVGKHIAKSMGIDLIVDKSEGAAGLTMALASVLAAKLATSAMLPPK